MSAVAGMAQQQKRGSLEEVLAALKEVIIAESGTPHEPSPTEYFASIVAALKASAKVDHFEELLQLLDGVLLQSNEEIVLSQFNTLREICVFLLQDSTSSRVHTYCLSILGRLIKLQETTESSWNNARSYKLLNVFLAFLDADTPSRVRKMARCRLSEFMHHHKKNNARSARSYIGEFCTSIFSSCKRNDYKRSLCVIEFLETSLPHFSDQQMTKIFSAALNLQDCDQPVLTAAMFRMVDCFFQSNFLTVSARQLNENYVQPIVSTPPKTKDMESIGYYCTSIASGVTKLYGMDRQVGVSMLNPSAQALLMRCEADFTQIHCAVGTALKRIIRSCVDPSLVRENVQLIKMSSTFGRDGVDSPLLKFLDNIVEILQMRYQNCWIYILDAIRALFQQVNGDDSRVLLSTFVEKVADIYQAITAGFIQVSTSIDLALKETLGSSLRSLGVVHFLQLVPFRVDPAAPFDPTRDMDSSRDWIINVLHSNVKLMSVRLMDFHNTVLVTAKVYNAEVKKATRSTSEIQFLRTRVVQLWSLFPSFCAGNVIDVAANFANFEPILQGAMSDSVYPEILYHIVGGLTMLAKRTKEKCPNSSSIFASERKGSESDQTMLSPDLDMLRKYSAKLLPNLMSVIESLDASDNSRFQPILQCISVWASISTQKVVSKLSKKLLQLVLSSSTVENNVGNSNEAKSTTYLAVILALIPYMSDPMIVLLYRTVKPLLSVHESVGMQKRAYSVLNELLAHHSDIVETVDTRAQILEIITSSLLTCHVSARYIRMNCMGSLLKSLHDSVSSSGESETLSEACRSILGEVLICLKDSNKKSRDAALDLLKSIYSYTSVEEIMPQLCSGLVAETSGMRSAVIIGFCILVAKYRNDPVLLGYIENLTPTLLLLLNEQCVEETRAILSYIKVSASVLSDEVLQRLLPLLLPSILGDSLGPQLKAKFSQRVRSIVRKLSQRIPEDTLRSLVPEVDFPLLDYICKQARRSRKKKDAMLYNQKLEKMMLDDSDEDNADSSDDEAPNDTKSNHPNRHRVKAIRSSEMDVDNMPSDLNDLLEGEYQVPSMISGAKVGGNTAKKRAGNDGDGTNDEDEDYAVQINNNGQVMVIPKLNKTSETKPVDTTEKEVKSVQAAKAAKAMSLSAVSRSEPASKKRTHEPGEEYRSTKAGGDVWKKGMLEPHAYIPLDAKMLTKKNQDNAVAHVGVAVSGQSKSNKRQRVAEIMKQQATGKVSHTLSRKQKIAAMKSKRNKSSQVNK